MNQLDGKLVKYKVQVNIIVIVIEPLMDETKIILIEVTRAPKFAPTFLIIKKIPNEKVTIQNIGFLKEKEALC